MSVAARQLGSVLLDEGLVTREQLDAALAEQARRGGTLGQRLVEQGVISDADLARALARQARLDSIDLSDYPVDRAALAVLPVSVLRRHEILPVGWRADGRLVVAMADPANVVALDDLRAVTSTDIEPVVASRPQLLETLQRLQRMETEAGVAQLAADEVEAESPAALAQVAEDAPIVRLVSLLITQAIADRASDIHVEPGESDLRIRYRVDGVLHEVMRSPKSIQAAVTSRIKVMAELNIAERRLPQDGRISMKVGSRAVDLRIASLPTVFGEKIVMRILDKSQGRLDLADLGFLPEPLARYQEAYRKPYGTILVTGPTGSGKSTTLYATINELNQPDRNIITVEDPVEYRLPGINQVQIHSKAGLSFAAALRSILRADPDVILVGEIRDRETAVIAIEAALTGHLVLSTLHTNDASTTPMRLVEMGVEPFLVSSALDCVVAQRLARELCDRCREPYQPTPAELRAAGWPAEDLGDAPWLHRAAGCGVCTRTGYRGRLAVHEVMPVNEEIERLIVERAPSDDVRKAALGQGMLSLREDGLRKVAMGRTSLEEIFRVVA